MKKETLELLFSFQSSKEFRNHPDHKKLLQIVNNNWEKRGKGVKEWNLFCRDCYFAKKRKAVTSE